MVPNEVAQHVTIQVRHMFSGLSPALGQGFGIQELRWTKSMDFGTRQPRLKSSLCHCLAVCFWASDLTSVPSLPLCKMKLI